MQSLDHFTVTQEPSGQGSLDRQSGQAPQGEDFFATQGYRELCVALLREAARDIARAHDGHNDEEFQATLSWLNGAKSPIPFRVCLEALGIDDYEDSIRRAILENPRQAQRGLSSFVETATWGQKSSVVAALADEAAVLASYRPAMR